MERNLIRRETLVYHKHWKGKIHVRPVEGRTAGCENEKKGSQLIFIAFIEAFENAFL